MQQSRERMRARRVEVHPRSRDVLMRARAPVSPAHPYETSMILAEFPHEKRQRHPALKEYSGAERTSKGVLLP